MPFMQHSSSIFSLYDLFNKLTSTACDGKQSIFKNELID